MKTMKRFVCYIQERPTFMISLKIPQASLGMEIMANMHRCGNNSFKGPCTFACVCVLLSLRAHHISNAQLLWNTLDLLLGNALSLFLVHVLQVKFCLWFLEALMGVILLPDHKKPRLDNNV